MPSGLNATPVTPSVCPLSVSSSWPVAASQTLTVSSQLAEARRLPSGLNATPVTSPVCPLSVSSSWPVAASQSLTVWSQLAEARRLPSGLNATPVTPPVCPLSVSSSWPVAASQTLTVWSPLAEALPSSAPARPAASRCSTTGPATPPPRSGCGNVHTLQVPGGNADAIAVDPATDTVYVTTIRPRASGPSTVSVFNGATCNATHSAGCAQAPQSVTVGFGASALAVNTVTDTIYVANFADSTDSFGGNTVSVIDGATCNATDTTGCANAPQTITLGPASTTPAAVTIDQATDTIYVADLQDRRGIGHRLGDQRRDLQRRHERRMRADPAHRHGRLRPGRDHLRPRQPNRRRHQHRRHQRLGHQRGHLQRRHQLQLRLQPAEARGRARASGGRGEPSGRDDLRLQWRWHRLDHPRDSVNTR